MMASCNTLLISVAPAEAHGRIMGLFVLSFMGAAPLGSLAAGALADRLGAPHAVLVGGGVAVLALLLLCGSILARDDQGSGTNGR